MVAGRIVMISGAKSFCETWINAEGEACVTSKKTIPTTLEQFNFATNNDYWRDGECYL